MSTQELIIDERDEERAITPLDLLNHALEKDASIETIEKFMGLQERFEANQARKAFEAAMAAAKAEMPVIVKANLVDFRTNKGRTRYRYEDLGTIARTIDPILGKHQLSYRYRSESSAPGVVTITCIISHAGGHSEQTTLSASHDESGNKNSIQAVGSAVTYLQRYSLKIALGLAASDDDDGQSAAPKQTGDEYGELWEALLTDASRADLEALQARWAREKALRDKVEWDDNEQRFSLQQRVKDAFDAMKAPLVEDAGQ